VRLSIQFRDAPDKATCALHVRCRLIPFVRPRVSSPLTEGSEHQYRAAPQPAKIPALRRSWGANKAGASCAEAQPGPCLLD
jgi:hypothetical protein